MFLLTIYRFQRDRCGKPVNKAGKKTIVFLKKDDRFLAGLFGLNMLFQKADNVSLIS